MRTRGVLLAIGVVAGLYGAWLLLSRQDLGQLLAVAIWLAAGVVLHDAVLAPIVLVAVVVGARALPPHAQRAVTVGLVVLGSVTLLAVPVLGRFGARSDNPTLLPRDYLGGWLVLAGLVVLSVLAGVLRHTVTRARPTAAPPDPAPEDPAGP